MKRFDTNKDGKLAWDELPSRLPDRLKKQILGADADGDGQISTDELAKIPAPAGRGNRGRGRGRGQRGAGALAKLSIPAVAELPRVGKNSGPPRSAARTSAFIQTLEPHAADGDRYVVLTDHTDEAYLSSLTRLAKHYDGIVVRVDDLDALDANEKEKARVQKRLRDVGVRFLAVAPRMESFRENTVLGLWEITTTLDDDPQVDVFPGLLVASTAEHMAALVDRSIHYQPQKPGSFAPFAISQVASNQELRSLQKSGILRKMFGKMGYQTPTLAVYTPNATRAPTLQGDNVWNVHLAGRGKFLTALPKPAAGVFESASVVVMHGHGVAGMSCSVDAEAILADVSGKVIMCGSCSSAASRKSDFPVNQARGRARRALRPAFALRAVDNGAAVVFGHMRLCGGFPQLFPVLECWLDGETVGEGYQRLINGILAKTGLKSGEFVVETEASRQGDGQGGEAGTTHGKTACSTSSSVSPPSSRSRSWRRSRSP